MRTPSAARPPRHSDNRFDSWQSHFFEPRRAGHLRLARAVFVHFHAQARAVCGRDESVLDDLALFDPVAPQVRRIDPVPLLHQELGIAAHTWAVAIMPMGEVTACGATGT